MLSTQALANTFLSLGFEENVKITPMKLQKLIYFLYKKYLKETGNPLFSEPFEKWKYGPVLQSIYYEFNGFGANPITRFAKNAKGQAEIVNMRLDTTLTQCIKKIWTKYKNYSAVELSKLTHSKDSAWEKAFTNLTDEDIKNEVDFE